MSVRRHLILLAAMCVLPAIVLLASTQLELRRARQAEVRRDVFGLAQTEAGEVKAVVSGARQFLTALAQAPAIREHNDLYCSAILEHLKNEYPSYASIAADDSSGRSFCSSAPGRVVYDNRNPAFLAALKSRQFAVGHYTVSPLTGSPVLPVAEPVITPDDRLLAVLVLSVDLHWLTQDLQTRLPPATGLTVADRNEAVLVRVPPDQITNGGQLPAGYVDGARGHGATAADMLGPDGTMEVTAYAVAGPPEHGLDVIATRNKEAAFSALNRTTRDGIVVIIVGLVLGLVIAVGMARRFIQAPIKELLAKAERLRSGDYTPHTTKIGEESELGRLGSALNALATALQEREHDRDSAEQRLLHLAATLEQRVEERTRELATTNATLVQAQKLDAIGQLTGGVAHDFNNLLAAILGSLELALKRTDDPRQKRLLTVAQQAAERGAKLTAHMLAFSRKQDLVLQPVAANDVIAGMTELLRRAIGPMVRVEHDLDLQLWPALADPVQLEVALLNLAVNARDAMPDGGTLTFRTRNVTTTEEAERRSALPPGEYAMITVSDTGAGMPADIQAKAFEPFFTTKGPGKGTGLGLSMAYGFARQAGGTVTIDSPCGTATPAGTAISLYLPRATSVPDNARAATAPGGRMKRLRVLVVDDDPHVRASTADMLRELGHEVREAANGVDALDVLRDTPDCDLMLADYVMPQMTGLQLADQVRARFPGVPVLLMTGYAESAVRHAWAEQGYHMLQKPFRSEELASALQNVMAFADTER
jgi:signal transduction histidine kinase/ActR/RegA family two-component response regulator